MLITRLTCMLSVCMLAASMCLGQQAVKKMTNEDITAMVSEKRLNCPVATLRTYLKRDDGKRPGEPTHRNDSRRHLARVDFSGTGPPGTAIRPKRVPETAPYRRR